MRTFAEDILLLQLTDDGELPLHETARREYILTSAVLLDLAFLNQVDTDLNRFILIDATPTGNPVLDDVLKVLDGIQLRGHDTRFVIKALIDEGTAGMIEHAALDKMVAEGVLKREEGRFLWMRTVKHAVEDKGTERHVKLRVMDAIFSDAPPDPRDAALIALVDACRLFSQIFSEREVAKVRERIDRLARLDLIGREMAYLISEFRTALTYLPHH